MLKFVTIEDCLICRCPRIDKSVQLVLKINLTLWRFIDWWDMRVVGRPSLGLFFPGILPKYFWSWYLMPNSNIFCYYLIFEKWSENSIWGARHCSLPYSFLGELVNNNVYFKYLLPKLVVSWLIRNLSNYNKFAISHFQDFLEEKISWLHVRTI